MRDNEEEFHPIIEYFSPAPGRNILGSGKDSSAGVGKPRAKDAGNVSRESIEFSTGITQKGTHF